MNKKRLMWIGIVVLVVLSLLIGGVNALCDNVQNHPSNNLILYYENEICTAPWEDASTYAGGGLGNAHVSISNYPYTDTKAIQFYGWVYSGPTAKWAKPAIKNINPELITRFSCVPRSSPDHVSICLYNISNVEINCSNDMHTYIKANDYCTFLKSGNVFALYVNGTYITDIGGTYNEDAYYIKFAGRYDTIYPGGETYYDDFSIIGNVVGTLEHTSVVERNVDNPASSTDFINTSYTWKTREAGVPLDPADSLITKYAKTGEIVNTTVPNVSKPCGIITYNISDMLYHDNWQDDNYGYYYQELKRGGEVLATDYFFYMYVVSGASTATINWDKDSYVSGDSAEVSWSITDSDFTDYTYKGSVWGLTDPTTVKYTWAITSASGTENVDLSDYETDTYFVVLTMRDKSTGHEYDIAGDTMALNEEILIEGITYNAETEAILGTVNTSFLQSTQYYNATSNTSTGEYNVSGLSVDIETDVNATKTNYTHNDFSFTPLQVDLYEMDIFMLPDIDHITYHNTSIGGLVQSYPFYQNVSGATVNLWNVSWNTSTTANSMGYYIFENLTNGTYSINATCESYLASENEEIETNNGSFLYHYILLQPQFILTVKAHDASTHATIMGFTAIVNDDTVKETTNGSITFTVGYGTQKVETNAEGFYASLEYVYTDKNTEKIMYLTPLESAGGTGTYYPPPHLVEFKVMNIQGIPYSNVDVTAIGIETTMTTWDKIKSLFGIGNIMILNETMSGTTDSNGGISFWMLEVVKYEMTFTKASEGINETLYIYPKEDHYKVIIGDTEWVETTSMWDVVNYSILINDIPGNDTHSYINFSYVDLNNVTSELYYFINQTNGTNSSNIYNHTYTDGDCANIFDSYEVERGEAYIIGFVADNDDYGEIKYSITIRIFEKDKRLLEFESVPDYMYTYISVGLICLIAAFFGVITVPEGSIVVVLSGWITWYLGWFLWLNPLAPLYLTVATVFAVLIIFTNKGRQKGVS